MFPGRVAPVLRLAGLHSLMGLYAELWGCPEWPFGLLGYTVGQAVPNSWARLLTWLCLSRAVRCNRQLALFLWPNFLEGQDWSLNWKLYGACEFASLPGHSSRTSSMSTTAHWLMIYIKQTANQYLWPDEVTSLALHMDRAMGWEISLNTTESSNAVCKDPPLCHYLTTCGQALQITLVISIR